MRGAQGPGDARGGRTPVRAHPRVRSRQVYTVRRLLAAMILLLALVLLVPRACQAILGSEDAPPRADQGQETPGKAAAGVVGDTDDDAENADAGDNSTNGGATATKGDASGEEAGGDRGDEGQAAGTANDLGEILFENLAVVTIEPVEPTTDGDLGSGDASVDRIAQSPTDVGDEWHVDRLASMDQQQAPVARHAPSRRQSSGERSAPVHRRNTGAHNTAAHAQQPPRPSVGLARTRPIAAVAPVPEPVLEPTPVPVPGPVQEQVPVPMVAPAPVSVPARPVAQALVRPASLPAVRGIPGRRAGASIAANARNVGAGFVRRAVGARGNIATAFPRAGVVRGAMHR